MTLILRQPSQTETSLKIFKFGSNAPQNGWRLELRPRPRIRIRRWGQKSSQTQTFQKRVAKLRHLRGHRFAAVSEPLRCGIKNRPGSTFIWPWHDLAIVLYWCRHCRSCSMTSLTHPDTHPSLRGFFSAFHLEQSNPPPPSITIMPS